MYARVRSREEAEDLCADVFEKALRAGDRYDAGKAAPGTWLFTITRNTVIDYYRKARPTEELPEELKDDNSPEEGLLNAETLEELAAALECLPADLVDIIVLHYYDRLDLTQISAKLGISYGAVKLRHQKALLMLRAMLEKKSGAIPPL